MAEYIIRECKRCGHDVKFEEDDIIVYCDICHWPWELIGWPPRINSVK